MSFLEPQKKTFKINYSERSYTRRIFFLHSNAKYKFYSNTFFDRNSTITNSLVGLRIKIYSGNKSHHRIITKWMVGFKIGEFSWTRKLALYKAKQLKKKKK